MPKCRSRSGRRWMVIAAVLAAGNPAAFAEDLTYLGGQWNVAGSWSPSQVPTENDAARLPASAAGDLQLNGGGVALEVEFQGGSHGYNLLSEPGGRLRTAHILNNGDGENSISVARLTGLELDAEHSRLVVEGGTETTINSLITDDAGRSLELWARAKMTNLATHTGDTYFLGNSRLVDQGSILLSPNIILEKASLVLDNNEGEAINSRLPDASTVNLMAGQLTLEGSGEEAAVNRERINAITVGGGASRINLHGEASLLTSTMGMTRDNNAHGAIVIDNQGSGAAKLAPRNLVDGDAPWAVYNDPFGYRPAIYDAGVDGVGGNSDDVGFVGVQNFETDINNAGTAEHVLMGNGNSLTTGDKTFRTLTMDINAAGNLNTSRITLSDGVVVLRGDSKVSGGINSYIIPGPGRELFVYAGGIESELAVSIGGGNGLTITPLSATAFSYERLVLSGSNSYAGQTTVNGGMLVLRGANALPVASPLRLNEASVTFDYVGIGTVPNRIIFDTGSGTPFGGGSFIRDFIVKDGQTAAFSGSFEGRGAYFVRGQNSTVKINTPAGTTALNSGEFSLWPQGSVTLQVDGQLGDGVNTFGSVIQFEGSTVGKGRITGGFQLSGGTLSPGSSGAAGTAVLRLRDLSLFGGEAHFNLNGTTRGTQYDGIDVDNFVFTGGPDAKLIVDPTSFTAAYGQKFDLIRYGGHFEGGQPTVTVQANKPSGSQWIYYFDEDSLTIALAGPSGDATLDGRVNFTDLVTLAQNYNQTDRNWTQGDFNHDGAVNFTDLVTLAQHYNTGTGSVEAIEAFGPSFAADWAMAQSLVPEPTTLLASAGLVALARRRRHG